MKRTWTALLAVAVLAVAAGVVWWWLGRSAWHPPASIKPALPDIALPQDGVPPQVKNALEKPLLWSSRAPVEAAEAESSKAPESELSQLRLMAVLESAGQRVALLQRPDRTVLKLNSSDPESGWRLESFDGAVAQFVSRSGQRIERPLERVGAAAPGAGAAPRGSSAVTAPSPMRAGQQGAANRAGASDRTRPTMPNGMSATKQAGSGPAGMGAPSPGASPTSATNDAGTPAGR